jgi:NAD(P)-dependent dehydrogenase (short-subunit alcohol dehydrogenase family)
MARVFVTGSADGLGLMAARLPLDDGHDVTLHARSDARAHDARRAEPRAQAVLVGELARLADVRSLATQANESGRFDAVIHNAAIGAREPRRVETVDGVERVFAVNVLAPYLLTALMTALRS